MIKKYISFCLIAFCLANGLSQNGIVAKESFKILFVGNSLTYYNNLPKLVKEEALQKNIALDVDMIAYPNYALIDHWNDRKVQKQIKHSKYDYVLIQQGPSSQSYGREILFVYGKKFKDLCEANGTQLAFLMVWPSQQYFQTFSAVIKNHEDAAKAINVSVCPVGKVWKNHFDATGDYSYYGPDGFHPSLEGSKIAAKVIVSTLF